jgi:iron complex transport system ATP-binding protein
VLTCTGVSFAYRRTPVLTDVSLEIRAGSIVGLLGPNGAGKTTLLKLLAGTLRPSQGSVSFEGRSLDALGHRAAARRIAVVPQETHPAFDYTVLEMALMGRHPWLGAFEIEGPADLAAATNALAVTGTSHLATRLFPTLSGGEKQRVIIASALAQLDHGHTERVGPSVLLLDEPTTSLDLRYQLEIADLIRRLHETRGVTVVLSTHDLRLARAVSTDVALLSRGRLLASGRAADVLTADGLAKLFDVDAALVAPLL